MATTTPTNDDTTALSGAHMPGDVILAPLRDDPAQDEPSVETPSTMRSRERRRRKARGSFYSRRRRGSGTSSNRGKDATPTTTTSTRRTRKFASRLGRSRRNRITEKRHAQQKTKDMHNKKRTLGCSGSTLAHSHHSAKLRFPRS